MSKCEHCGCGPHLDGGSWPHATLEDCVVALKSVIRHVQNERDTYARQLTDVGYRLQQAVGSPGGMSLPEQIEHGLQAAIEQQAKIKRLREELQVALGRDEQWLAAALVVCHKEIEQLRAAKAAGGGDE